LLEAIDLAARSQDDDAAARSWIQMIYALDQQGRFADAALLMPAAEAAVGRLGAPGEIKAQLVNLRGIVSYRKGDYPATWRHYEEASALLEQLYGPESWQRAFILHNMAKLARAERRFDQALQLSRRDLALREKLRGPDHPDTAGALAELATILTMMGKFGEALVHAERALAIVERAVGPDHPSVLDALDEVTRCHAMLGRWDQALPLADRAVAIAEKLGPAHPSLARRLNNRGIINKNLGRFAAARADYQRTAAIQEQLGEPGLGLAYSNLGYLALAERDFAAARAWCDKALAFHRGNPRGTATDAVRECEPLVCVGLAELGRGAPAAARAPLERAIELYLASPGDPIDLAEARFALARALGRTARGRELAAQARAAYAASDAAQADELAAIDAWLAGR
jgi:serine/threonine-protein kinase